MGTCSSQESNLKQEEGQYPSQYQQEFYYSDKMEEKIQKKSDQEVQEFMHKQNEQNNCLVKKQNKNLQFEKTACSTHKDQDLVFLNRNSQVNSKLICIKCFIDQQIQKETLFMLEQFFTMSEEKYLENFLKFKQEETNQIFEKLFDKNYGQRYSKLHIDALQEFKKKIIQYIDTQIKQISEAMQKFQKMEENLKQQYNDCNKQFSFQQILSQKNQKASNLEKDISKILEDQSKSNQKFESSLTEYLNNLSKEINEQDQKIQNFEKNIIDFISNNNNKLTINCPQELENLAFFKISSKIISQEELQMIQKWIGSGNIRFKQIYAATQHGFQIENIHKQCKDKTKVIFLIKTSSNKRFGFYSDLQIKNYGDQYVAQNPNNIFLFSLDLKQKYTSNESYCQNAFYSNNNCLALGDGHDICLHTNSNQNQSSFVYSSSYGKKEGLSGYTLNGGTQYFQTNEIEIFEVIQK